MTVTDIRKDPENLKMTLTAVFDAGIDRVWELWANPRLLERWWGPPTYPATFVDHDLSAGGHVSYFMTGPEGDKHGGWWRVLMVDPPRHLEFEDGFSNEDGTPNLEMPAMTAKVTIVEDDAVVGGARMTMESTFPSLEAMEEIIAMGVEEGLRSAVGQIDELLLEGVASA